MQGRKIILRYGHQLIGDQCEGAAAEHVAREVGHERGGLKVEVSEHFVGTPSAEEADDVGVDVRVEESVSASGLKAVGSNIGG